MEHTITVYLAEEEEKQLCELVNLFKKYRAKTGEDTSDIEKSVFDMWVRYGLGLHMAENYEYFKTCLMEQLKEKGGDAA